MCGLRRVPSPEAEIMRRSWELLMRRWAASLTLWLALAQAGVSAADLSPAGMSSPEFSSPTPVAPWRPVDEVRLGVFAHDAASPEGGSVDINGEILSSRLPFSGPAPGWEWLAPRLHAGTTVNTAGDTSHVYAGFTWTVDLAHRTFVEGSFGGALHNGETEPPVAEDRNALGCSPLFRESASLGFRVSDGWSVMATVEHLSNAGLCDENRGLTNYGARLGYRF
jgi:lipid A 3-O-deacylase